MIARYSRPEMANLWNRKQIPRMAYVEILACEANTKLGLITAKALATIKKKAISRSSGSTCSNRRKA